MRALSLGMTSRRYMYKNLLLLFLVVTAVFIIYNVVGHNILSTNTTNYQSHVISSGSKRQTINQNHLESFKGFVRNISRSLDTVLGAVKGQNRRKKPRLTVKGKIHQKKRNDKTREQVLRQPGGLTDNSRHREGGRSHHLSERKEGEARELGFSQSNHENIAGFSQTNHEHSVGLQSHENIKPIFSLGLLNSRNATGWTRLECNTSTKFRLAKLPTAHNGNLSMYIYDSIRDDLTLTAWALRGKILEADEIDTFLELSKPLPIIDVGANLGTVALQAAMQMRPVVALEPVFSNAHRLCRSALDFDLDPYLHVLVNAASSHEGEVTLAADDIHEMARFSVQGMPGKRPGFERVTSYAILLDRLLEVMPFTKAALKIDVEAHEGYVLAGAERLFQQIHIPLVWLEWEHAKRLPEYGGQFIVKFMRKHKMEAYDIISDKKLQEKNVEQWPNTILWKHNSF